MSDKPYKDYLTQAETNRNERAKLFDEVLSIIERRGSVYSVDIAKALGVRTTKARSLLHSLEKLGLLKSTKIDYSPKSGQGRRYYELK